MEIFVVIKSKSTFGSVRFGSVRFGSVRFGSVRFGSVRFGSVRFGSLRFASVRFVSSNSVLLIMYLHSVHLTQVASGGSLLGFVCIFKFSSVRPTTHFTRTKVY